MRKPTKPCLVGLLNVLLTVTVADEPVGPPPPVRMRMQANPLTANTAPTFVVADGNLTIDYGQFSGTSIAKQSDGKILVGGHSSRDTRIFRYSKDGIPDDGFGFSGLLINDIGGWGDELHDLALQADGKIISIGSSGFYDYNSRYIILTRHLPDGNLDATFGYRGMVTSSVGGYDLGQQVLVQPDGKILVSGYSYRNQKYESFLIRYLGDGSLDINFGDNGIVLAGFGAGYDSKPIVMLPDNKILLLGNSGSNLILARYNENGSVDATFGTEGKVFLYGSGLGISLALQSDGKILILGRDLMRLMPNGSVDESFGISGKVVVTNGKNLIIQDDGKIVVAGATYDYGNSDILLSRYTSSGSLDQEFGLSGRVSIELGTMSDYPDDLGIMPDGKYVVLAERCGACSVILSYLPDGSIDNGFSLPENTLSYLSEFYEQGQKTLASKAQILDNELAALGTYSGATLTLVRQGGANSEDVFSANTGGPLTVLTPGSYFAVDGVTIGQVLTNSAGTLQLRFLGANATQARVDKAMQQIAYRNASDRPPAQVLIDWTFDDGNTGAQGTGGALSTTGTVTVNISPQNDWPLLIKAPPPQTAVANVAFSYTLPADTFNDPDDDPLTWNLAMADGTGLPPWLSFNPATRLLSGTPTEFDIGTLNLRIIVKDPANASAEAYMNLRVTAVTNTSGLNASILPTARSVQIGQPATAFGTLINTTGLDAWNCYLAIPPDASIPATFTYQTTNDSNQLIGTVNTSIDISAGSAQNFVFGITPNAAFNTTDIPIVFDCANTVPAPSQAGLNTFLLSASSTPAPDMVAIGATPSGDGVLRVPGSTGIHAFGASAVNIGATGTITATADTGGVSLPLTLTLCQTNPGTGGCLAPPAASVSSSIGNQQVATYAVFAQATGAIAFDPSANRIFLRLSSGGVVRGGTSVAVTTE